MFCCSQTERLCLNLITIFPRDPNIYDSGRVCVERERCAAYQILVMIDVKVYFSLR